MTRKWRINLAYDSNDSKWLKTIPRPPGSDSMNDSDSQSVVGGGNEAGSVLVTAEKQLELKRKQVMVITFYSTLTLTSFSFLYIIINRQWHIAQGKIY